MARRFGPEKGAQASAGSTAQGERKEGPQVAIHHSPPPLLPSQVVYHYFPASQPGDMAPSQFPQFPQYPQYPQYPLPATHASVSYMEANPSLTSLSNPGTSAQHAREAAAMAGASRQQRNAAPLPTSQFLVEQSARHRLEDQARAAQFMRETLARAAENERENTKKSYRKPQQRFLQWCRDNFPGRPDMELVTEIKLAEWLQAFADEGRQTRYKSDIPGVKYDLSPATLKLARAAIVRLWNTQKDLMSNGHPHPAARGSATSLIIEQHALAAVRNSEEQYADVGQGGYLDRLRKDDDLRMSVASLQAASDAIAKGNHAVSSL